ncbi:MAG: hypothetical protein C4575_01000 [Desulforudis sp.]|jgi:hypothetical protein|nr:MAG: hypothetical protein C4575_01000 [Desulforudis sp.]
MNREPDFKIRKLRFAHNTGFSVYNIIEENSGCPSGRYNITYIRPSRAHMVTDTNPDRSQ